MKVKLHKKLDKLCVKIRGHTGLDLYLIHVTNRFVLDLAPFPFLWQSDITPPIFLLEASKVADCGVFSPQMLNFRLFIITFSCGFVFLNLNAINHVCSNYCFIKYHYGSYI